MHLKMGKIEESKGSQKTLEINIPEAEMGEGLSCAQSSLNRYKQHITIY